jgi:branched-chain amino acid transport system ATP-binding protein
VLAITDLAVGYGPVQVLFGLSLSVGKGECLAVLGPNGAGKTTLLATISGFLSPRAGHIRLEGSEIGDRPPHAIVRAGISQVMQGRQVLGPMSVRDNLLLGAHLRLPREGRAAVDASLRYVHGLFPVLADRARMAAGALSGGEQQMLAIGRALMSRPTLLLLDEPSMGLGPLIVEQILEVLGRLKDEGLTMVLVEQNPDVALRLADRCGILESGHLVAEGTPDLLRNEEHVRALYLGGA